MNFEIGPDVVEDWKHLLLISKFGVNEIETKLDILNEEYMFFHDYNPIEHITTRIKEPEQIIRKLQRLNRAPTVENARKYVHDIGGIRVICSFTEDVYTLAELLRGQDDIRVLRVKDYIKNPKPNGYRSLHLLLSVPVFLTDCTQDVTVEVQIRTIGMDLWASVEHKLYYKQELDVPEPVLARLRACADALNDLDAEMVEIKKEIAKCEHR